MTYSRMSRWMAVSIAAVACMLPSCRRQAATGRAPSPRIVSFSPAITQMMLEMGLGKHLVGVTSQDILPDDLHVPVVGDAFSVNAEAVVKARPDMVLVQMQPERFEAVRRLDPSVKIEHLTIETLDDIGAAMERIATVAGQAEKGRQARRQFQDALDKVAKRVEGKARPRVLFITDFQMLGTAGRGTFIDQMIERAGGVNVAARYSGWTTMTAEGILAARPEVVFCQVGSDAEGGRAKAFLAGLKDLPAVQTGRVYVTTDKRWTIPCAELARFTSDLADKLHGSEAATSPSSNLATSKSLEGGGE